MILISGYEDSGYSGADTGGFGSGSVFEQSVVGEDGVCRRGGGGGTGA